MARAYNNVLAILLATIGLAIPLTANMHTPKLIDMFLRDRVNQVMLTFFAPGDAHDLIQDRLQHLGTIILKAVDRGDRSVAREGIWSLKRLLDDYGERKRRLPAAWFAVQRKDFVGMSAEAIALVNADRTWFEHRVMTQVFLAYQAA